MNRYWRVLTLFPFLTTAILGLMACGGSPTPAASTTVTTPTTIAASNSPVVVIASPASNSIFNAGTQVQVNSTASSRNGVLLVELSVDGRLVQSSPTPNSLAQPEFTVTQNWTATPGQHTLTVRATDARANTGDASILVNVGGSGIATVVPPPSSAPATPATPATPIPITAVPATPAQPVCTLNSAFLSDVTIPDHTVLAPGSPFVKTWQLQNTGTCAWGGGFTAVFISGSQLAAPSPSPVPATAAGATVNLSLNMVAPTQPGQYQGTWQLQASNGSLFGIKFDVLINISGGPTIVPIPPTGVPSSCSGTPSFSSFTASANTIQPGQIVTLNWGQVYNASNVVLNSPEGSSGVATPGQVQVQPDSTTTYSLTAYCYDAVAQAQVTVNVQGPPAPTVPPNNSNQISSIQVDKSSDGYKVTIQYYWDGEDSPAVISAVGVSAASDPVTDQGQAGIQPNFSKYVIINLTGKDAAKIDVCMLGHSQQELACASQRVK